MKYNVILHITTSCNFDCSYCDVIKDKKNISQENLDIIINFIKNNKNYINRFKFFGGEPLLNFESIKYIINNTKNYIGNNYEIVTNASLLIDDVGVFFSKYFKIIFFSIDSENYFNFDKITIFINKYNIEDKLYFNLIINPGEEDISLTQFKKLYNLGFRGFNILPIYFTKSWTSDNLKNLSKIMKEILNLSLVDKKLRLYGFTENMGEQLSLTNESLFIDIDKKIYYSDIVSTYLGNEIKNILILGDTLDFNISDYNRVNFKNMNNIISLLEEKIYNNVKGQRELKKIMDYFSKYLNKSKGN